MITLREIVNRFLCCADDDVEEGFDFDTEGWHRYLEDKALKQRIAESLPGACYVMNENGQYEPLYTDPPQFNFRMPGYSTVNYITVNLKITPNGLVED